MNCVQCGKEFKAKRQTAKYCSAQCRKLAFHKNGKVSVPKVSVPANTIPERYFTDAAGNQCKIDYEGRRKTQALLDGWALGKGTAGQQRLAILDQWYDIIHPVDMNRYLGYAV